MNATTHHFRVARPVTDVARAERMYCNGLGFQVLARFEDHQGFDEVILGDPAAGYHLEFTVCRKHPVHPAPTPEDLLVLYVPEAAEWNALCAKAMAAGFEQVESFNPYWDLRGKAFRDSDDYRLVLQSTRWKIAPLPMAI